MFIYEPKWCPLMCVTLLLGVARVFWLRLSTTFACLTRIIPNTLDIPSCWTNSVTISKYHHILSWNNILPKRRRHLWVYSICLSGRKKNITILFNLYERGAKSYLGQSLSGYLWNLRLQDMSQTENFSHVNRNTPSFSSILSPCTINFLIHNINYVTNV